MKQQEEKKASYPEEGVTEEVTHAPAYDDESSFCNCENNECLTPYESDDSIGDDLRSAESDVNNDSLTQHQSHTENARQPNCTVARLKKDFLEAGDNPYIQRDHTCRIGLYRKKGDTEPIDSFESNCVHRFSARAMLLLGASLLGIWALIRILGKEQ